MGHCSSTAASMGHCTAAWDTVQHSNVGHRAAAWDTVAAQQLAWDTVQQHGTLCSTAAWDTVQQHVLYSGMECIIAQWRSRSSSCYFWGLHCFLIESKGQQQLSVAESGVGPVRGWMPWFPSRKPGYRAIRYSAKSAKANT